MKTKAKALLVGAMTLALAGCGLQPASQYIPEVEAGPELDEFESMEGLEIVTTSKDFTEQLVLGRILTLVMAAQGAEVTDRTDAKGSVNAREAMMRDDADIMWEYTGTAWVAYFGYGDGDPSLDGTSVELGDSVAVHQAVKEEDLQENQIYWSDPAPFNNTYAIAVTEEDAEEYDLTTLDDIQNVPESDQTFCLEPEFESRGDGWPGMQDAYDMDVPSGNVSVMDAGIVYSQVGDTCFFGEVFDTDGRIVSNNLVTLEDNRNFFPIYEPAVTVRESIYDDHPDIAGIFEKIGNRLDTDTMRDLNQRVDVQGENPVNVAQDWLTDEGFLAEED